MSIDHKNGSQVVCCDECGRQSDDAELQVPERTDFRLPHRAIEPGWAHFSLDMFGFDVCPICLNMKFSHLLIELKRRMEANP